jgi:opacity protein-like surface antigen
MKKIVFCLCFLTAALQNLTAQAPDTNPFRFGLHTSPTWSWARTDDKRLEGIASNWGIKLGTIGEYYFANNYAVMSGIGFGLNQGGTIQNGYEKAVFWNDSDLSLPGLDTIGQNAKLHYRLNYVEIPIGIRMRGGSNEDQAFRFYAEAPVFTLSFRSRALGDIRGTQGQNSEDEVIKEDVIGAAISWGVGAGIEYELATHATLVAGLSYQQQFTDFTPNNGAILKNSTWQKEDSKATIGLIALRLGIFF